MEFGDPRLPERFWKKINRTEDGCWVWTGAIKSQRTGNRRYATYTHEGKQRQMVMVVAMMLDPDYDPKKFRAYNTCENEYICANPEHISTKSRNECKNGHQNPERNAHNMCKECKREGEKARGPRPPGGSRRSPRRKPVRPIEGFTVFGDRPPGEIWRPSGWPKEVLDGKLSA